MARGTAALLVLREVFCGTLRTELRSSEVIAQDPAPSPCPAGGVAEPGLRMSSQELLWALHQLFLWKRVIRGPIDPRQIRYVEID